MDSVNRVFWCGLDSMFDSLKQNVKLLRQLLSSRIVLAYSSILTTCSCTGSMVNINKKTYVSWSPILLL